jgi:hypothetical protein
MARTRRLTTLFLTATAALSICRAASGGTIGHLDPQMFRTPTYTPEGDAFLRHDGDRFNNRPLYCNQISAIVIAGDRPLIRFGSGKTLNGTLLIALSRNGKAKWLHDWSDITSKYHPDHMEWILKDDALGATTVALDAVPPAEGPGMAVRLRIENAKSGDQLIWAFGGAVQERESILNALDATTAGREALLHRGFTPDDCRGNRVTQDGDRVIVQAATGKSTGAAVGQCDPPSKLAIVDASAWADPIKLAPSPGNDHPLIRGLVDLEGRREVHWAFVGFRGTSAVDAPPVRPAEVFAAGLKRAEAIGSRVVVDTPDPRLNAEVAASNAVTDGVFRDGMFTHAGMRWGVPLLGWRCLFGGIAYGWHDRVLTEARTSLAHQITESDKTVPKPDPKIGLAGQSLESRLFGKGRVDFHNPWHYDMQSQFFDQLIHEWRATGDPELEKILRPALELHLQYIHDCFDPDDDGLYESYANTWPTDDQWYNGGGTAEETAYAYTAERAAWDMAARAHDTPRMNRHEARFKKIEKAFFSKLWDPDERYVGGWVEQGGHERLHKDGWLYATFCPIDAGLLDDSEAASALYHIEWGLEREHMPYGGQRCWTSNWVPSVWSLREMWPGDNYHLALAYFQTGLADDGWDLLRGTFPAMAFYGPVPGDLGYPNGGTDFNDCASMFCRAVVEGLFGYRPDYPSGGVTIAPQFPSIWDHASIKTPDVSIDFRGSTYRIALSRPARLRLLLPVRARKLASIRVNGQPPEFSALRPGFGCSIVEIRVSKNVAAQPVTVELTCEQPLPQFPAVAREATIDHGPDLSVPDARMDQPAVPPFGVGHHLVQAYVEVRSAPQYRLFKVNVSDPAADAAEAAQTFEKPPAGARWDCLDLSHEFNADVRTIFQQKYLSPRPNTCSLRLATDGYSTWQMMLDKKHKTPTIDLANLPKLREGGSAQIRTAQGVPFTWNDGERNIAFTSMWDNWPRQVTFPVNRKGDGIWLLLCGFTPPMQGRIANAELRLNYADGHVDKLDLVPPFNFWSLCPFGPADYDYARDGFCLPKVPPQTVQLGNNCRAILLNRRLRPGVALESVTLETVSQETIIGLMGVSVMNLQ